MTEKITMICNGKRVVIQLEPSIIAEKLLKILPFSSKVSRWGREIYFSLPFSAEVQELQEVVQKGDVAYWPPGRALCIFWGTTPASMGDEIRAASGVFLMGRVIDGMDILESEDIREDEKFVLEEL